MRQEFLDYVLKDFQDDIFKLGNAYGNEIAFPTWFKHFAPGKHGVGEAYHLGIFGKTGSGKTGLAKMLLCAYARHPSMGILVIDPQGEFSLEVSGKRIGGQQLDILKIMQELLGREVRQFTVSNLRLTDWNHFQELLAANRMFERALGIRGGNQLLAAQDALMAFLKNRSPIDQLARPECAREALDEIRNRAEEIYCSREPRNRLLSKLNQIKQSGEFNDFYRRHWWPIASLFQSGDHKYKIDDVIRRLMRGDASGRKPIIVMDLSNQSGNQSWPDTLQKRIISYLSQALIDESSKTLTNADNTANTLVVLDEAHRFVPSTNENMLDDEDRMLRSELKRAVRETRKYSVVWMFISQTMRGIDDEILTQLRAMLFGYGL